ncbi:MAG: hypothetical protein RI894_1352, partial [Bacteroidota bacterium]
MISSLWWKLFLTKAFYCGLSIGFFTAFSMAQATLNPLEPEADPCTIAVAGVNTWTTNMAAWTANATISTDWIVPTGQTMIIGTAVAGSNTTIKFLPFAKITVQPGGKLIVRNATLTSTCSNNKWQGIILQGTNDPNSTTDNFHGVAEISNSTLSSADIAIQSGADIAQTNTGGGIARVTNTTFLNNARSFFIPAAGVLAWPTSSYFYHCSFLLDNTFSISDRANALVGDRLYPPSNQITVSFVAGLVIKGCYFKNGITTFPWPFASMVYHKTLKAIDCIESSITVDEYPSVDGIIPCRFLGFDYGIYIAGIARYRTAGVAEPTLILHCEFGDATHNVNNPILNKGIYTVPMFCRQNYVENMKVMYNKFYLPEVSADPDITRYGAYFDYFPATNKVAHNVLEGQSNKKIGCTGFCFNRSYGTDKVITNNTFRRTLAGVVTFGKNRSADGITGLHFRCNTFESNAFWDIVVMEDVTDPTMPNPGIKNLQGTNILGNSAAPANNVFTAGLQPISLDNAGGNFWYYQAQNNATNFRIQPRVNSQNGTPSLVSVYPVSSTTFTGVGTATVGTSSCPLYPQMTGGGGDNSLTMGAAWQTRVDALALKGIYTNQLQQLEDGGNTPLTENEVAMTQLQDAYALYADLMAKTPYLSEEVLQALAEKENFPPALLRDILVANKHAGKSREVWEKLENRSTPLPEYMIQQIKDAAESGMSGKEYLEMQIANQETRFQAALTT